MAKNQTTIGRRPAMVTRTRADDMKTIPAPGTVWEWSAVGAGSGTLQILRNCGLIKSKANGWETTRLLARFVSERRDYDLDSAGQA